MSTIKTEFKALPLTDQYAKSATELFAKCFCSSEPITAHLGITAADYEPFAREIVTKAIKEGYSRVTLDKQGKVIGLCIAEDLANPFQPNFQKFPKLKPVFELLREVSKPFLANKKIQQGKIIHVWIAGVDPDYRGHGLSTAVVMSVIEQAARRGYEYAYAEFTNEISEKVTRQFNVLKCLNRIKYDDFKIENSYPFKGVKGSASAYVATIKPGVKLEMLSNSYTDVEKLKG